jgi:glycine/D-amino acid oxidase-like deaminating enzyme
MPRVVDITHREDLGEIDFISVGGGLGGLAGAIFAHDAGMKALVIEKSPLLGGVSAYSGGTCWVPTNHLMGAEGIEDTFEEASDYLSFIGGSDDTADLRLRRRIIESTPKIIEKLSGDIPFQITGGSDQYWSWAKGSKERGRQLEAPFPGSWLGRWQTVLRENPYFPSGLTLKEVLSSRMSPTEARIKMQGLIEERAAAGYLTSGSGLLAAFIWSALVKRGIPCLVDTPVTHLTAQDGAVTGVVATVEGKDVEIPARLGVLIATGGYGYASFAPELEGLPTIRELSPPIVHGDGMMMASSVGAAVVRAGNGFFSAGLPSASRVHPGTDVPLYLGFLLPMTYPHSIVVNLAGQRFADESVFGAFSSELPAIDGKIKKHRNVPCFFVCDDQYRQRGFRINGANDGWPTDEFFRADTLEELADHLGIDREGLAATISRYNEFEQTGVDTDFQRGTAEAWRRPQSYAQSGLANPLIGALREPPFWGARLDPLGLGICSHGLKVDEHARAVTWTEHPIPGLYGTGNAVAYTDLPFGYQDGYANSRNIVLGAISALHAATR